MPVREPPRHASGHAGATHEPVHADGRKSERLLVSVTAEPHERGLLVEQPGPAGEKMDLQPLERLLHRGRHRDLTLTAALPRTNSR